VQCGRRSVKSRSVVVFARTIAVGSPRASLRSRRGAPGSGRKIERERDGRAIRLCAYGSRHGRRPSEPAAEACRFHWNFQAGLISCLVAVTLAREIAGASPPVRAGQHRESRDVWRRGTDLALPDPLRSISGESIKLEKTTYDKLPLHSSSDCPSFLFLNIRSRESSAVQIIAAAMGHRQRRARSGTTDAIARAGRAFISFMMNRYNVKALILLEYGLYRRKFLWIRLLAVSGRA
jgi:hypothetical protein